MNRARILSSESSVKQEQNTNINIKIQPKQPQQMNQPVHQPLPQHQRTPSNQSVNFTQAEQNLTSTFQPQTSNIIQDRGIADLGIELDELETKNHFLEMIIQMYENNPLKINSYLVCESTLLMDMIKLLTQADKVELVIEDCEASCGCIASNEKGLMKISKIMITKNQQTEDFKYCYNNIYSQFIKYGISLKLTV